MEWSGVITYISCPYLKYFMANSSMEYLPSCNEDAAECSLFTEFGVGGLGIDPEVDDLVPGLDNDGLR